MDGRAGVGACIHGLAAAFAFAAMLKASQHPTFSRRLAQEAVPGKLGCAKLEEVPALPMSQRALGALPPTSVVVQLTEGLLEGGYLSCRCLFIGVLWTWRCNHCWLTELCWARGHCCARVMV